MHHNQTSIFSDYNPNPYSNTISKVVESHLEVAYSNPKQHYLFEPKISCSPSKMVIYNEVSIYDTKMGNFKPLMEGRKHTNLTRSFHNFELSDNAVRTIKKRINWLFFLSKSRLMHTYTGKTIPNFKLGFYTFTLPSKQIHSTSTIISNVFSQFINEMQKYCDMKNYIWRLEFQDNKNVHFHLVTDSYLDYFMLRRKWNTATSKLGYVQAYSEKMNKLTLTDYFKLRNKYKAIPFDICKTAYAKGKAENWMNPNSVDVKPVKSNNSIAYYISKYMTKEFDSKDNASNKRPIPEQHFNDLDTSYNSKNLRLWFCSQTLSKVENIVNYLEEMDFDPINLFKSLKGLKRKVHDYCTIFYIDFSTLTKWFKWEYSKLLRSHSNKIGYIPSG